MKIKFGTSGWRGIIARDFTFANLEIVTRAIASYLYHNKISKQGIIIGYDTRFMSGHFALKSAETLSQCGIPVYLTDRDTPTPAIAFHLLKKHCAGAINISASHNPPEYNGVKFSDAGGGPASVDVTQQIEKAINHPFIPEIKKPGKITTFNPQPEYLKRLDQLIDFSFIKKNKPKIAVDCLYGTSRDYLDAVLNKKGARVTVLHNYPDPMFGGGTPDPNNKNLAELSKVVLKTKSIIGLATDGDADRFGFIDRDGSYINANDILAIMVDYLITIRGLRGGIVRSMTTSHLLDVIAAKNNRPVFEVPVGFKYVGSTLLEKNAILGGEESSGMSIQKHLPEKDGVLACLLVAEIVTRRKKSLKAILKEIRNKYGAYYATRIDIRINAEKKNHIIDQLRTKPFHTIGTAKLIDHEEVLKDNFRYTFSNNSWIIVRPSGTEPIMRCYMESKSKQHLKLMAEVLQKKIK